MRGLFANRSLKKVEEPRQGIGCGRRKGKRLVRQAGWQKGEVIQNEEEAAQKLNSPRNQERTTRMSRYSYIERVGRCERPEIKSEIGTTVQVEVTSCPVFNSFFSSQMLPQSLVLVLHIDSNVPRYRGETMQCSCT